jgi:hypothetical protein
MPEIERSCGVSDTTLNLQYFLPNYAFAKETQTIIAVAAAAIGG